MQIIYIFLLLPLFGYANTLSIELSQVATTFNFVQIPNNDSNRITLPTDKKITGYRLSGTYDIGANNFLYFLIAPFEKVYQFQSNKNFEFNNTSFTTNTDTEFTYKFNSYRLGYFWSGQTQFIKYWYGFVGKIRDAKTRVTQGTLSDEFSNIGFVPLLGIGFELFLTENITIFHHTDALGASQGSAYDSQLDFRYAFSPKDQLGLGMRILGGGADNDTLKNFAQFEFVTLNYTRSF
jgi:hypothetical protein